MSRIVFAIFGEIRNDTADISTISRPTHVLIQLYPVNNFSPSLGATRWQINHKKIFETKRRNEKKEKRFIDQKPRGNNSNFDKFHNKSRILNHVAR
jgi:hypothetical protein